MACLNKMTKTEKLEVLQEVANAVVTCGAGLKTNIFVVDDAVKAIKALELVLAAIGARQESVFVDAMNPEGSKPELSQPGRREYE